MPSFGKRIPLTREHFQDFETCYQATPQQETGEDGRWRYFNREDIEKRNDNLDMSWLRDESLQSSDDLPEPDEISSEILERLQIALDEMNGLIEALED